MARRRRVSKEEVVQKLKDDGDFDRLRVDIIRHLKDNVTPLSAFLIQIGFMDRREIGVRKGMWFVFCLNHKPILSVFVFVSVCLLIVTLVFAGGITKQDDITCQGVYSFESTVCSNYETQTALWCYIPTSRVI